MRDLLSGQSIDGAFESVRLFLFCEGMKWAHLPVAGGIYDQHPQLIDEWEICFREQAAHSRKEAADRERQVNQQKRQANLAYPGA